MYLAGRDATEKLRAEEARKLHEQAVAKDPAFALAHLALANAATSAGGSSTRSPARWSWRTA